MITSIYKRIVNGTRKSINLKYNINFYKDTVEYSWIDNKKYNSVSKCDKDLNEYQILRNVICQAKKKDNSSTVLVVLLILSAWELLFAPWMVFFCSLVVYYYIYQLFIPPQVDISLYYNLDEKKEKEYQNIKNYFQILKNNEKIWLITAESPMRRRTNGGAGTSVTSYVANISNEIPFSAHSNISTISISCENIKLFVLPDKLLYISGDSIDVIDYKRLSFEISSTRFVEAGEVQADTTIVEETWLNVNKDGSPDRRFSYNRKIPVCKYAEVRIKAEPLLDLKFYCSNLDTANEFINYTCDIFPIIDSNKVSHF